MKIKVLLICAFLIGLIDQTTAQNSSITQQIDSLFVAWNVPNHPGGAIGVMQDDQVIYSKAFGLASLEYLVPNAPGTIFNTGSVSKQFTAMGIVLLEQQGKLSFDDDIRKHIPELPDFGETITIRHMLHHTSGLRSLHALFGLAGWRGDDSRTNADLNRIIVKQKELNFKPGDEYLYCNTGYMLMATIIENITGESFVDWMKANVFEPLGMIDTYVEDQYNRIVPNNATSYQGRTDFEREVEYWGYVGSGNMHSTTGDLLKWLSNFYAPKEGWEAAFKTMQTLDPFNDGTPNDYAFGVVVDTHLGQQRVGHGGSIGGFRAYVCTFPEKKLSIAVLTNFSSGNPGGKAGQIARIILGDKEAADEAPVASVNSISLSTKELTRFEGTYWNDQSKFSRKIYLKEDTLRYSRSATNESPLVPVANNTFKMLRVDVDLKVSFEKDGDQTQMVVNEAGQSPSIMKKVTVTDVHQKELAEYAGTYDSPEIETAYRITVDGDAIAMHHIRHGVIPLQREFQDILSGNYPIGVVQVQRNPDGEISGLLISNGRVRNLWFERQ